MRRVAYLLGGGSTLAFAAYQLDKQWPKLNATVSTADMPHQKVKWDHNWDRRHHTYTRTKVENTDEDGDNNEKIKPKPKATRHLLLIRHGQYVFTGQTQAEKILTPLGREQADFTGQRLKTLDLPIDRIIISTMTRAQETGEIISKYFPDVKPEHTDLIREGAPIPPEPPSGSGWSPDPAAFYQDGARIEAGFRKYFHRATPDQEQTSYELMICHANVIRYYVCRALQLPPESWLRMSLHNGSITWITIRPNGKVSLRMLGECGHMSPNKLTTT